ncbi:hypothetical protein [Nitrosomonas sp. Nm132]|nr:hypothetical protein [Nitrosomonas sp. Nm132]
MLLHIDIAGGGRYQGIKVSTITLALLHLDPRTPPLLVQLRFPEI